MYRKFTNTTRRRDWIGAKTEISLKNKLIVLEKYKDMIQIQLP